MSHGLTAARLRELFHYDPESGVFTRKTSSGGCLPGETAGGIDGGGYVQIRINGRLLKAHRLAWLYVTGEHPGNKQIDHIDCNRSNNRWSNLRLCDQSHNRANIRPYKNNTSGFKGVSWNKKVGKWMGHIRVNSRRIHLGYFHNPEDAAAAYLSAAKQHFGEYARTA